MISYNSQVIAYKLTNEHNLGEEPLGDQWEFA